MKGVKRSKIIAIGIAVTMWSYCALAVGSARGQGSDLSPVAPRDVTTSNPTQKDFDNFAWQLFVALNWPTKDGKVDMGKVIGQAPDAPRVWELYTDPINIFKDTEAARQLLELSVPKDSKLLYLSRKRIEKLSGSEDTQAAPSWPLIDQSKNFAVYEIRINDIQKNYIVSNGLTTPAAIGNFKKPIVFPFGSIEVKAAWRLFPEGTPKDVLARYHTRKSVISISGDESSTKKAFQIHGTVGLVGLHIVCKTRSQPKWIWATFEQVDNYEVSYKPLPGLTPTFSSGQQVSTEPNRQPMPNPGQGNPYLWSPSQPTASLYTPTQVARCPNEPELPSALNARWQKRLAGVAGVANSPWQYYRLNAVQWFYNGRPLPENHDKVAVSRNSVLETYLLGDQTIASQVPAVGPVNSDPETKFPNSTLADTIVATVTAMMHPEKTGVNTWSSCVICHQMALYQYGTNKKRDNVMTDYSFVFRSFLPAGGTKN
ncbi:MAG TPA: hypothetical protein VJZ26_19300 [Blastocatellia bacterium]|nr:hypothetical protein [Blastocatellia bacterium]